MINRKWYYVILQSRAITPARKTLVESQIDSSRDNDFIIIKTIYIYIYKEIQVIRKLIKYMRTTRI